MTKYIRTALFATIAIFTASASTFADQSADSDTILVIPFENTSKRPEYNWVGESFSEMFSELLDTSGLLSIRPDERNLAYEREGLPSTAVLTRATSIKIGERANADLVIVGTYRVDGDKNKETITVSAKLVDIREGRIVGTEFNSGGQLKNLQELQGEMAYEILKQRNPGLAFSRGDIVGAATKAPEDAFADYMKAVLTSDRKNKALFLARAIDTYAKKTNGGQYNQAVFELGRITYLEGKYADASNWLAKIDRTYPRFNEAAFYLSVCLANTKQNDKALSILTDLVPRMPLYEVYNNAGVVYMRAGRIDDAIAYLKPAAEAATRDLDTQFNYGYALWLKADYATAAAQLQKAVKRRASDAEAIRYSASDGEAFYLLAKASERSGQAAEAAEALDQAKRYLPSFAQWETKKQIPELSRLKSRFSMAGLINLRNQLRVAGGATRNTTEPNSTFSVVEAMQRARDHFSANRDREALDVLGRVLQVNPDNAEAHLLRGRIYERGGNYDRAIEALKAATFWDPKRLQAFVIMGKIYVFKNDCANAETAMKKALQIDPSSADALALKRSVEQKCQ